MKVQPATLLRIAALSGLAFFTVYEIQGQTEGEASPFVLTPVVMVSNSMPFLSIAFRVPGQHHLYADRISFELDGVAVAAEMPNAKRITDKFSKSPRPAFENDFRALCPLPHSRPANVRLSVTFQGCNESECYFPETREWRVGADDSIASLDDSALGPKNELAGGGMAKGFHVAARASGFLSTDRFLGLLDESRGAAPASNDLFSNFAHFGMIATVGLILLGGLALNLTPCVLPMIPINLAILGAGAQNQNRRRSFLLGATYGGGMAFAYGLLGLVVVLTGSRFGALNATSGFNFAIAAIFILLGLAMFDKLAIDFSRFQRSHATGSSANSAFLAAGAMGGISALLAGACVAPVVISVLLLAATFYQKGNLLGLLLPFILGLGMAIPWPFAAAGLSFLPRPGAWMTRVRYAFGIFIFGFAAWYGWLGFSLSGLGSRGAMTVAARGVSTQELKTALEQSRATGRPVVVDFWASWCKNCEAMEHSTFRDANVRERLGKEYILVKFQAERLNDAALKPVLDEFGVMGLPTCIVLLPDAREPRGTQSSISEKK